jgi:hypothetical protein
MIMTTPASPITVSVATDQASYVPGQAITATVTYTDSSTVTDTLTVTATVTDSSGNTATGSASASVVVAADVNDVAVADNFGDTYTQLSNANGTAVFTGTVGTGPAAAPAAG